VVVKIVVSKDIPTLRDLTHIPEVHTLRLQRDIALQTKIHCPTEIPHIIHKGTLVHVSMGITGFPSLDAKILPLAILPVSTNNRYRRHAMPRIGISTRWLNFR